VLGVEVDDEQPDEQELTDDEQGAGAGEPPDPSISEDLEDPPVAVDRALGRGGIPEHEPGCERSGQGDHGEPEKRRPATGSCGEERQHRRRHGRADG